MEHLDRRDGRPIGLNQLFSHSANEIAFIYMSRFRSLKSGLLVSRKDSTRDSNLCNAVSKVIFVMRNGNCALP